MVARIEKITISGYKTIKELKDFRLRPLNVLIGPNGAGKSNFCSFFRLARAFHSFMGGFRSEVARLGGANRLVHQGIKMTPGLRWRLEFSDDGTETDAHGIGLGIRRLSNGSSARVTHGAWDMTLRAGLDDELEPETTQVLFAAGEERFEARAEGTDILKEFMDLTKWVELGDPLFIINGCMTFHLHDTSSTSRLKQRWSIDDNIQLKADGGNLAAFLLRLRTSAPDYFLRIVRTVRTMVPFFQDFVLEPEGDFVLLRWSERDSDLVFGPSQASDGMLRIFILAALLLQPEDRLPPLIIVDEPELGLHPYAVEVIAGMFKAASIHTQVIVATQSVNLVDQFDPEDIVMVDRAGCESFFRRLDLEELEVWLQDYSISELWEKNVLGGRSVR